MFLHAFLLCKLHFTADSLFVPMTLFTVPADGLKCGLHTARTADIGRSTVIPRLTKIIRSVITFVSRNVMLSGVSLLAVSNVNNPVGLVGLPCVMWSAHFFFTHIQTEKISSWNGPTVHVCCFMLARAYPLKHSLAESIFVSRVRKTAKKIFVSRKIR